MANLCHERALCTKCKLTQTLTSRSAPTKIVAVVQQLDSILHILRFCCVKKCGCEAHTETLTEARLERHIAHHKEIKHILLWQPNEKTQPND